MPDAITAQEIKDIRGMYGLSQKSFAQLLGIGPASMVRYEQGAVPSKANANLIRAARHPEFMLECLERDGNAIPMRQCEQARKYVYAFISLDNGIESAEATNVPRSVQAPAANRMSKMDKMYHYTIQQEVLNEQAANLIGELISIKITTGFIGKAGDIFEELLNQLAEMKPRIVSRETMDDESLASIRGYLRCAEELVNRRLREVE
ncbi:MAG: transcriptional regulator [Eggerthellaceae bacterium]|nr:transcriptional regulator [Eggerthellaceae bacterium]